MATRKLKKAHAVLDELDEIDDLDIENEDDLKDISKDILKQAVVFSTDWTTEVLIQQLKKGNIDLDPAFQRRDAWTIRRKSLFIESLIVGLPVPQIVLAEKHNSKGTFLVIDGKQRLLSLLRFTQQFDNQEPFALSSLKLRADLNGFTYVDLQTKRADINSFQNQTIRAVVIRNWHQEDMLYLIFHRLNSETLPLSPQELRQALHPGPFLRYCDQHSQDSEGLRRILKLKKPDFRMRDIELLVRYFAFSNYAGTYTGNLKDFLDKTCEKLNSNWKKNQAVIKQQTIDFESAVQFAYEIFDGEPFRKWDGKIYESRFNRAIFDVILYYFARGDVRSAARIKKAQVSRAFKNLCKNSNFVRSIETTTKSKKATATRFNLWGNALSTAIGLQIRMPAIHE